MATKWQQNGNKVEKSGPRNLKVGIKAKWDKKVGTKWMDGWWSKDLPGGCSPISHCRATQLNYELNCCPVTWTSSNSIDSFAVKFEPCPRLSRPRIFEDNLKRWVFQKFNHYAQQMPAQRAVERINKDLGQERFSPIASIARKIQQFISQTCLFSVFMNEALSLKLQEKNFHGPANIWQTMARCALRGCVARWWTDSGLSSTWPALNKYGMYEWYPPKTKFCQVIQIWSMFSVSHQLCHLPQVCLRREERLHEVPRHLLWPRLMFRGTRCTVRVSYPRMTEWKASNCLQVFFLNSQFLQLPTWNCAARKKKPAASELHSVSIGVSDVIY